MTSNLSPALLRGVVLAGSLVFGSCSCSSPLADARSAWNEARYADAATALETASQATLSSDEQCRYALYSGLTYFSLGDLRRSIPQLSAARRRLEGTPECFTTTERGQLLSAWQSLGVMPGQPLLVPRKSAPASPEGGLGEPLPNPSVIESDRNAALGRRADDTVTRNRFIPR